MNMNESYQINEIRKLNRPTVPIKNKFLLDLASKLSKRYSKLVLTF